MRFLDPFPPVFLGSVAKVAQNTELCTRSRYRQKELQEKPSVSSLKCEKGHLTSQRVGEIPFLFICFPVQTPGQPCRGGGSKGQQWLGRLLSLLGWEPFSMTKGTVSQE